MARKDVTDLDVVQAIHAHRENTKRGIPKGDCLTYLIERTGQPKRVCIRAMERAEYRGLIDYGVTLRTAWLLDAGVALLKTTK